MVHQFWILSDICGFIQQVVEDRSYHASISLLPSRDCHGPGCADPFGGTSTNQLDFAICWTALAPLRFVRNDHHGTDLWYRVISTYGSCVAHEHISSVPFVALLTIANLGALVILNVQAYKTRSINTEYSESKYIVIVVASMAQAGFIGIPLLFLVGEEPQATFVVRVLLIFVTCSAILCLIFIPKILHSKDVEKQRRDYTLTRDTRTTKSGQSKVIESTQGSVIGTSSVNLSA